MKTKIFHSHRLWSLVIFLYILIAFNSSPRSAFAEDISLEVSPTHKLVEISKPNSSQTVTFSLKNTSEHPETVRLEVFPIEKIDKKTNRLIYQSKQSLSKPQQSFYTNAISFVYQGKVVPEVVISPRSETTIEMNVRYNTDQKDSDYSFTVGFITSPEEIVRDSADDTIEASLPLQAGVGSHVFVALGESLSEVVIQDIKLMNSGTRMPDIALTLTNRTKKTARVYGNISIYNMFGLKIASYNTDNFFILGEQQKILHIDKSAFISSAFATIASIGSNNIKVHLYNPSSKQHLTIEKSYLYFPFSLIIFIGALLVTIFLVRQKLRKKGV